MKKVFMFMAVLCLVACGGNEPEGGSAQEGDFVDLGLTSGTKWKKVNEFNPQDTEHGFYKYAEAVETFGENLPTKDQWTELVNECTWDWTGMGYKVTGSNGKSIILPADGCRRPEGDVLYVGLEGSYWSSTQDGSTNAWHFVFRENQKHLIPLGRGYELSVRLVKK